MLYTIPRYWKLPRQYMATYRRPVIVIRHLNTGLLFLNLGAREIVIVPFSI